MQSMNAAEKKKDDDDDQISTKEEEKYSNMFAGLYFERK